MSSRCWVVRVLFVVVVMLWLSATNLVCPRVSAQPSTAREDRSSRQMSNERQSSTAEHMHEIMLKSAASTKMSKSQPIMSSAQEKTMKGWGSAASRSSSRVKESSRTLSVMPGTRELQLGLQFTVPFLNIPLRSLLGDGGGDSTDSFGSSNTGGFDTMLSAVQRGLPVILLVGLLAASVVIMVPFLASATGGRGISDALSQFGISRRHEEGSRLLDMLSRFDDVLAARDIRPADCIKQTVCRYSQAAASAVQSGAASSSQLIAEGLAKSEYIGRFLRETSVGSAVSAGRSGDNCGTVFPHCSLSTDTLASALTRYITAVV